MVKTEYPAKNCDQADFGDTEHAEELYKAWAGFSLLCPDHHGFVLEGNSASMIAKYFSLEISRCDPTKRTCATSQEIDNFYEDIQIDSWSVFEKMDFLLYGGKDIKPVFR
jgi:hypothetical protein